MAYSIIASNNQLACTLCDQPSAATQVQASDNRISGPRGCGVQLAVLVLIIMLAIYLIWLFWRWSRLPRPDRWRDLTEPLILKDSPPTHARGEYVDTEAPSSDDEDEGEEDARVSLSGQAPSQTEPETLPRDLQSSSFDTLIEVRELRFAVKSLQAEQADLREDVESLIRDNVALRRQLEEVQAFSRVSPQYGEAVSLARRGADAQQIAERCGISISEAELVRALASTTTTED